ncbi:MAG: hypothetical protein QXG69_03615 [Candidatus Caldarchaeum sp.]|uniref:Pantoate kinase n=1 Tax=Caldiarchaeum subterraneum TaxID=311458 RepID=A0A7C5LF68_CALS0
MKKAFIETPAPLSSIFSPKVLDNGRLRQDPDRIGARGGGFSFTPGVETTVEVLDGGPGLKVEINGELASFPPSEKAVELSRKLRGVEGFISVKHRIHVPIATGFGTSAASALGVLMALSHLAGKPMTLREAVKLTHYVELECRTGLNSEAGFGRTGLVLVLREGSPDHSITDEIPLPSRCKIVSVVAGQIPTSDAIASVERLQHLERLGDTYIERILQNPTPENFLSQARAFAAEAGLVDQQVHEIFTAMERLPTLGYAMNMVGRAAHALVYEEDVENIAATLRTRFPQHRIVVGGTNSSITLNTL